MALRNQNSTSGLAGNCNSTMTEGEGNLSQQDRNICRRIGNNCVEELRHRRPVCPYGAKRFLKFPNTLSGFDVLTAVVPDDVVA